MSITATDLTNLRPEQKRALLEKLLREKESKAAPLSSAQKRLWFLERLQPNSAVYNVPTVLRLSGAIHVDNFRKALERIVERHDALRTVFEAREDSPVQKVRPMAPLDLPLIDFFARGGALKSSWYGDCLPARDFPMLVDLHLQGRLPLEKFVSETIGLDDVEAAFDKMHKGEVLRSVVVF